MGRRRGIVFSLPQLLSFNIREGSFDYVEPEQRPGFDSAAPVPGPR